MVLGVWVFFFGNGGESFGISLGADVGFEGVVKNYTGPENALNDTFDNYISTSVNMLIGGYASFDQIKPLGFVLSGANVMALVGAIDTEIRCPAGKEYSSVGLDCDGDASPETETLINLGVVTTLHVKHLPLLFGIRYTLHSTAFVFGFGGLKAVNQN